MIKSFITCAITGVMLCAQVQAQQGDTLQKINTLVKQMTLQEKVNMIHASSSFTSGGVPRLGIPEMVMSDGPHGVRAEHGRDWDLDNNVADSGTYLPVGTCLAATWNPALGYAYGSVLGSEANARGKDVILGPGINIIRTPLNGRNFEYLSEDPYLISRMAVGYIRGVQDQGITATVKHFAANNQEIKRTSINVEMSERALREIYLPGFKAAVQEGNVNAVMGSYNKFRGQWASQNYYLLTHILRKEWGFKGITMSDWNAVHSSTEAFYNGMDIEMGTDLGMLPKPNYGKFYLGDTIASLVQSKRLPEYLLDEKVRRILYVMMKTNMLGSERRKGEYNATGHQQVAAKVAEEGMVLLKNANNILPLNNKVKTVAVIGYNAVRKQSMGGGSSQVKAFYEVSPLEGIQKIVGKKVKVNYVPGYEIKRGAVANTAMMQEAVKTAAKADVVVYVGGTTHGYNYDVWADNHYDAEDTDKPDMMMPFGQDELLQQVIKANPKTVVVLFGGGPVDMSKWIDDAPAVIQHWYAGMEGGNALAKILFGQLNPSGKLPMTFPKKLEDNPSHVLGEYPGDTVKLQQNYFDDIYVGYRYYDTYKVQQQFAFGHGLSYTSFQYSDLQTRKEADGVVVSFRIKNTGNKAGAEVAQVYVSQQQSTLPRPEKELKGFEKVMLQAGEEKQVTMTLSADAFKYYNDLKHDWVLEKGNFTIKVGGASDKILLQQSVAL